MGKMEEHDARIVELREELRVEGLREREGQLGPGRAAEPRRTGSDKL